MPEKPKQEVTRAEIVAWAFVVDWRDFKDRPLDAGGVIPPRLPRSLVNDFRRAHPDTFYRY